MGVVEEVREVAEAQEDAEGLPGRPLSSDVFLASFAFLGVLRVKAFQSILQNEMEVCMQIVFRTCVFPRFLR